MQPDSDPEGQAADARLAAALDELEALRAANAALEAEKVSLARAAEEVAKAKDAAEAANRAKTEFLAMMSHELRTPLNAILGFSEIIRSEALGSLGAEEYRDYASDIYTSGAHLLALINDLLDLAKVEAGMVELREELIEPAAMVEECVRLVGSSHASRGVQVIAEPVAANLKVTGDRRRLRQILLNILSNAAKFTPDGKSVHAAAYLDADGGVVFEVRDEGIGIAEDDIKRVLEPFVQIDSALNRNQQGTGLGLPLCRQLAELHGGALELESTVNMGTTVRVRLPAARTRRDRATAA